MERASERDDLKAAVMAALSSGESVDDVAKAHNVSSRTVRYWRGQMPPMERASMESAVMERASKQDNLKAAVVAAVLSGQSVEDVSKAYNVPERTIRFWRSQVPPDQMAVIRQEKHNEIGALLMGYLRETLETLTVQARFFRNESWLSEQTAADVAILHGVAFDKSLRLLEAIERANGAAIEDRGSGA